MTGAEFRAMRERYGWTPIQVARALYYNRGAVYAWESGKRGIPPPAIAWASALPPLPAEHAWPPATSGGFRVWYLRHHMTCREVAEFCGVAEHTVYRWLDGISPVPLAVRAWLRAGAPPHWDWAPPGSPHNVLSVSGKPLRTLPTLRPAPRQRIGSHTARKFRQAAQPRPRRQRQGAVA